LSDLYHLTASEVTNGIKEGSFRAEDYISQILQRIEKIDLKINSFINVYKERALKEAIALDKKIKQGLEVGRLAGVAVGIKDNICTKDMKTTCASKMLENYIPPYDATVVEKLRRSGAIIVGKLNLDEFAMGSTTQFSIYGPTRNPWDTAYVPGGSSGGSASSVAAFECAVSLGSDTGGSVRCPSSFCSVVGLKPTYGLVSRYGLISYANSLEQIGPIGKSVSDIVMTMNVIAGNDDKDHTTVDRKPEYFLEHKKNVNIGLVKELIQAADPAVAKCIYSAVDLFIESDYICEEISLKSAEYAVASYYTIAMAEASSNLARYDNIRYGYDSSPDGYEWNTYYAKVRGNFGEEVKRRILLGSYVLSSRYYGKYYLKAQKIRSLLEQELNSLYDKYDVLISPTMPILPFKFDEKIEDPLTLYKIDINTVVANLAGIPAISIPAGFNNGLPIGLQIMAKELQEQTLLNVAFEFENRANIKRSPQL
jgi:aspartyl-tRNA(Asn)/glutamyl-tRNA(Gln) amidotransferase subunit A